MQTFNITAVPLGHGRFAARLGELVLVASTTTPLLCAARALRDGNADPSSIITLQHEGSDVVAVRSTIGTAAAQTVVDNARNGPRFAPHRPFDPDTLIASPTVHPGRASNGSPVGSPRPASTPAYGLTPRL